MPGESHSSSSKRKWLLPSGTAGSALQHAIIVWACEAVVQGWIFGWTPAPPGSAGLLLLDEAVHSITAASAWWLVSRVSRQSVFPFAGQARAALSLLCAGGLGAVFDVDHFIHVGSLSLERASHLGEQRPFLHCVPMAAGCLACCAAALSWASRGHGSVKAGFHRRWLQWFSMAGLAWGLHLLRDGTRRGIWLWPSSLHASTAPLPWPAYLGLAFSSPVLLGVCLASPRPSLPT